LAEAAAQSFDDIPLSLFASISRSALAGAGMLYLLCIDYTLRSRLSSRLTLGGRTCPRKP